MEEQSELPGFLEGQRAVDDFLEEDGGRGGRGGAKRRGRRGDEESGDVVWVGIGQAGGDGEGGEEVGGGVRGDGGLGTDVRDVGHLERYQ